MQMVIYSEVCAQEVSIAMYSDAFQVEFSKLRHSFFRVAIQNANTCSQLKLHERLVSEIHSITSAATF